MIRNITEEKEISPDPTNLIVCNLAFSEVWYIII